MDHIRESSSGDMGAGCKGIRTGGHGRCGKAHTPIVSRQQQKLFGMVASGNKKLPGLSKKMAKLHLDESRGRKLPRRV